MYTLLSILFREIHWILLAFFSLILFYLKIFIIIIMFILQYCIGFAIHQHEFAIGVHMFSIPEPPFHLPPHTVPLGHPSGPAPSILYPA